MQASTIPVQVLSEESLTKVCLITDLNKASKLLSNHTIEPDEFDQLYDLSVEELEDTLMRIQGAIHFRNKCLEASAAFFKKYGGQAPGPRYEEEGD